MRNQIDEAKTRCQVVSRKQVTRLLRRKFKDFACQLCFERREKWRSLSWHDFAR